MERSNIPDPHADVVLDVIHISDTHLGYERRKNYDVKRTVPWISDVDTREQFRRAVELAAERDADAVVHTGDLFDDYSNVEELDFVEDVLVRLRGDDVPIYVLMGNHDYRAEGALERVRDWEDDGLLTICSRDGHALGDAMDLYGVHFKDMNVNRTDPAIDMEWWKGDQRFGPPDTSGPNVLCLHESVNPPVRSSDAHVPLEAVLDGSDYAFDFVLAGHIHIPSSGVSDEVPVQYAGPTARIVEYFSDSDPRVNHVRVYDDGTIETSSEPLPSSTGP